MSRAAITGASGLVGRHLLAALGEEAFAVPRGALTSMAGPADPAEVLAGAEVVYHLAAQTVVAEAWRDPVSTYEANVALTWRLLDAARGGGVRRVVIASTGQVYAPSAPVPTSEDAPLDPDGPYSASKAAADVLARSFGAPPEVVVARLANVYGPGDTETTRLIPGTIAAVRSGEPPVIRGDGTAARDMLHIDDAVAGLRAMAHYGVPGEAYNVGTGVAVTVRELVDAVIEAAGSELDPVVEGGRLPGEGGRRALDGAKLRRATGWEPRIGLAEGLRRVLAAEAHR